MLNQIPTLWALSKSKVSPSKTHSVCSCYLSVSFPSSFQGWQPVISWSPTWPTCTPTPGSSLWSASCAPPSTTPSLWSLKTGRTNGTSWRETSWSATTSASRYVLCHLTFLAVKAEPHIQRELGEERRGVVSRARTFQQTGTTLWLWNISNDAATLPTMRTVNWSSHFLLVLWLFRFLCESYSFTVQLYVEVYSAE